jgi:hypothetical protein
MIGVGALGLLQLAEDDRARLLQASDDRRVFVRTEVAVNGHAVRGGRALGPTEILDRDGHAVQRSPHLAGPDLLVGDSRLRKRGVSHDVGVTLELAVELPDPLEHRPRHLDG